jgi:hypothetical protein
MAFENVFGNIDFQAPTRARQQEASQLQQLLGQAIQNNQQMKLKKAEIEAKGADPKILAQKGGMKIEAGRIGELTPEEITAIKFESRQPPVVYTDRFNNQVVEPNRYQAYLGQLGGMSTDIGGATMATSQEEQALNQMMGQPAPMPSPDTRLSVDMLQGGVGQVPPINESELGGTVPYNPPQDVMSLDDTYKAPAEFGAKGKIMEEESRQRKQDTFVAEKMKRQIQGVERYDQSQLLSANFSNRMVESSNRINNIIKEDPEAYKGKTGKMGSIASVLDALPLGEAGTRLGDYAVAKGATAKQQMYLNAADNWISANLRKESGAVISPTEMAQEYKKYFPIPTDKPEVIEQKRQLREETEKGMIGMSAGAYQEVFGKKGRAINEIENTQPSQGWSIKRK